MSIKSHSLRIDLEALHKARRKLQILQSAIKSQLKDEEPSFVADFCEGMNIPSPHECKVLLDLIQDAENVLYPSFQ